MGSLYSRRRSKTSTSVITKKNQDQNNTDGKLVKQESFLDQSPKSKDENTPGCLKKDYSYKNYKEIEKNVKQEGGSASQSNRQKTNSEKLIRQNGDLNNTNIFIPVFNKEKPLEKLEEPHQKNLYEEKHDQKIKALLFEDLEAFQLDSHLENEAECDSRIEHDTDQEPDYYKNYEEIKHLENKEPSQKKICEVYDNLDKKSMEKFVDIDIVGLVTDFGIPFQTKKQRRLQLRENVQLRSFIQTKAIISTMRLVPMIATMAQQKLDTKESQALTLVVALEAMEAV